MSQYPRSMYGSRFSGPYCPGASSYKDDLPNGGKMCSGTMGTFNIDSQGNCDDDNGCSLALTGPMCPGTSRGVADLKNGQRKCTKKLVGGTAADEFIIGRDGNCVDPNNCSTSLTSVLKKAGGALVEGLNNLSKMKGTKSQRKRLNSKKGKAMCYSRKQKGKSAKKRVCMDSAALKRLKRGARKGGKRSHRK